MLVVIIASSLTLWWNCTNQWRVRRLAASAILRWRWQVSRKLGLSGPTRQQSARVRRRSPLVQIL